jgi:hypothetical protein
VEETLLPLVRAGSASWEQVGAGRSDSGRSANRKLETARPPGRQLPPSGPSPTNIPELGRLAYRNPVTPYAVPFGAVVSFREVGSQRPGIFVVRELSYHAARITSCENPVRGVAGDHAARTDNRP